MQTLSDNFKTALARDLIARHRTPAAIAEHLSLAMADAKARREQAESELAELTDLGARADRELNRDRRDVDDSIATISAHLAAHRARREAR